MSHDREPNSHEARKDAVAIPLGAAIGEIKPAIPSTAKMLSHSVMKHESPPIQAIRACEQLAERSDRSVRAAENITALGEMTRGIAHDFRNILAMLKSGLNIAEANMGDRAKLGVALAAMQAGVARGLKTTNLLLAFARQQEPRRVMDDINALLSALKPFLSYGAGPGVRVVLELAPVLHRCLVDPAQLNAAILNLIINARDAMPEGGVVRISTMEVFRRSGSARRKYVRVRVRDNGAGMPRDVLAQIFDPFFTTKGDNGTGLGLPHVLTSMRQVGGEVSVHSVVGKGTTFDLFFPVHEDPPAVAQDNWLQLDRWADEGGAIAAPPDAKARR